MVTNVMTKRDLMVPMKLGINGLGRIGKLTVWHHAERRYFSELVVNIGRQVGTSLEDIALFIEKDSTYGSLHHYIYGCRAQRVIEELSEEAGTMRINGVKATILREERNPLKLPWRDLGVELVVDATGKFLDPTLPPEAPSGSSRGHLAAGAKKVIVSAPFKIKDKEKGMPQDCVTTVMGINDADYDHKKHLIVSNASCTTTCLAYMMKPLIDFFGHERLLSASMATVHAATSSQPVLDRAAKAKAVDFRKNRSVLNNIILTTTGAARALALVIPEMENIGFIAESVRIPVNTGSLIILVINLQDESLKDPVNRENINDIYQDAADNKFPRGYLLFSEEQNVSSDIIGAPRAAAVIEGHETHTRTFAVRLDLTRVAGANFSAEDSPAGSIVNIPVTQVVIYGWYDNELASYTNMLGDRAVSIADLMLT